MALKPLSRIPLTRPGASSSGGTEGAAAGFARKYSLQISFGGLIAGLIILVIAFGWIFAFGVIVGRGYNPEEKLPELAQFLPPHEGQKTDNTDGGLEADILKAEELTFMRELKQRTEEPVEQLPAAPVQLTPEQTVSANASPQKTDPPLLDDKTRYDFVFQVAAFRNADQADTLREQLEGESLRTRMIIDKDTKGKPRWYRVQVVLRGTEVDAAEVVRILHENRLKDARVVSKILVEQK